MAIGKPDDGSWWNRKSRRMNPNDEMYEGIAPNNTNAQQWVNQWVNAAQSSTYSKIYDEYWVYPEDETAVKVESAEEAPKRILPVNEVVLIKGKHFSKEDIATLQDKLNAIVVVTDDLTSLSMLDLDELQEKINEARKHV